MIFIFPNAGLARKGEAGTIEDKNLEQRNNNKDILKGRVRNDPVFLLSDL